MKKPATKDVLRYIIVPLLFLTVALTGGIRFTAELQELRFIAPQLVSLILAVFVMIVFVRGGLVQLDDYLAEDRGLVENASGLIRLAALYFATIQVFNAV